MATEYELKIHMPDKSIIEKIQSDEFVTRFVRDGFRVNKMSAIYYDTADWDLYHGGYVLRMRSDGTRVIVSLKHGWIDRHGMSPGSCTRKKWLCTSSEIDTAVESLMRAGAPVDFQKAIGDKPLIESCHANFTRTSTVLYMPEGLRIELAMDEGEMVVGENRGPILEMEFEVLFGNIESMRPFMSMLSDKYRLTPEFTTKYEKAYSLYQNESIN